MLVDAYPYDLMNYKKMLTHLTLEFAQSSGVFPFGLFGTVNNFKSKTCISTDCTNTRFFMLRRILSGYIYSELRGNKNNCSTLNADDHPIVHHRDLDFLVIHCHLLTNPSSLSYYLLIRYSYQGSQR